VVLLYGVSLVLLVVCVVDVMRTPREQVRTLPKALWLVVVLPPVFGPAAWFLAGRPSAGAVSPPRLERGAPDDDEDFLRELRRRAEEQRRRAKDPRDD
jgi:hypothetical protein